MNRSPAKILFTCGREPAYPRNALMLEALRGAFEVTTVTAEGHSYPLRYLRLYAGLKQALRQPHDLVAAGFLAQPLIGYIRRFTKAPILFDAFLSTYDTLCFERKTFSPSSPAGRAAYRLDRSSCEQADLVTLDTQEHVRYFCETFGVAENKLRRVFVGCDERIFHPRPEAKASPLVLFYGSFLPLQGVEVIVRAAALVEKEADLRFRLIGNGPTKRRTERLMRELGVNNIELLPPVPLTELPGHLAMAEMCLGGHFGAAEKARRAIAGKTYQMLAMGRPTIVGDNPANAELLTHGQNAWFCKMNDPQALAEAILHLHHEEGLRKELGLKAVEVFRAKGSREALMPQWQELARSLLRLDQRPSPDDRQRTSRPSSGRQ